jgi:hypothetical protein
MLSCSPVTQWRTKRSRMNGARRRSIVGYGLARPSKKYDAGILRKLRALKPYACKRTSSPYTWSCRRWNWQITMDVGIDWKRSLPDALREKIEQDPANSEEVVHSF